MGAVAISGREDERDLPLIEHRSNRIAKDAVHIDVQNGRIEDARLAFGGMAATPKRANQAEAALLKDGFDAARTALARDFQPLDDWRGTAAYRLQVAANLLRRLELRLVEPQRPVEVEAL